MKITDVIADQAASITESATHPNTTIPVIGTVASASWFVSLPTIINICTVIYLVLLITHKAYTMYLEYKTKKATDG